MSSINYNDIETGALDSTAARVSWNPTRNWSLQASWADIKSPEALEPHHDEIRFSASGAYVRRLDSGGLIAARGGRQPPGGRGGGGWARRRRRGRLR